MIAQVAELVDALVSGASGFAIVQVRVLFWALPKIEKMQSYTEDEIVVQLRDPARQREAFAKVVSLYGEKLYWHIRKMVLDHEDANDLLQNTFLKAWTNIELFRGEAKLSTWLYKIAINECITFLNKQRNMNNVSIDDADTFLLERLKGDEYFDGDEIQVRLQRGDEVRGDVRDTRYLCRGFEGLVSSCGEKNRGVFNKRGLNLLPESLSKQYKKRKSMKKEENNLDRLKGTNPFTVPEGYMEGLTERIMSQLPEKQEERAKRISLMDRVRPWLYMAAVFAGLGLFFKAIVGINGSDGSTASDSLLVRTEVPTTALDAIEAEEDEEYLEYLEAQYANYLLDEELSYSE